MTKTSHSTAAGRGPADHEVRNQIVTAATEHFSRYGYEKTTVSDLAKEIGFSKAYIYKFFESKQAIGEMICANCLSDIESEVRAAVAQADRPPEKLRRMFKAIVESSLRLFFRTESSTRSPPRRRPNAGSPPSFTRSACRRCCGMCCRKAGKPATSSARRRWMKPPPLSIW